ncbi:16S rRNA (guanine(966)-N(2))-methyltransferase RsmD, partial [Rhizobium ruizarguesonis]
DVVVSVHPSYVFLESRIFGDTRVHFFRYQPQ